jgi:hypothetical protein
MYQPTLRFNSASSLDGPDSVSVCCLAPSLVALLASCPRPTDVLKSFFQVTVAQSPSPECDSTPSVSGRYLLFEEEVQFIPHFPFERDVKYRASFDPRPLGATGALNLEFLILSEPTTPEPTEVSQIFPSGALLPENLLRFYICFSNSMQRGRALEEISLLDCDGRPVVDALYRPPVELWDRTMRRLTVLLDPGRLKRWVGPNVALGPPLKARQTYTLQIGAGMIDQHGHRLVEPYSKHFVVGDPVREHLSTEKWRILPPATDSRQPLVLVFPRPLDWALLLQTITVKSADGLVLDGNILVDECETRWSFTPRSVWTAGIYHIYVGPSLADVCGNSISGAFERPLRQNLNVTTEIDSCSLVFELI